MENDQAYCTCIIENDSNRNVPKRRKPIAQRKTNKTNKTKTNNEEF